MKIYSYDVAVVGSGAAGLSAAARLKESGKNVVLVTENMNFGTSRNTGSDKQTYYKLSLSGDDSDSVRAMAENMFSFGAVDGDNALCEAALSARCFMSLVEGGVPFPSNRYGEFVGYKTDHDPYRRATSAGPLTSKFMTEMWERRVRVLDVAVLDGYYAIEILQSEGKCCGLICLEKKSGEMIAIQAPYVILATGGPAGIYADSVYPHSQNGALGLAADAGVSMQNLTEWQYGLASTAPRWNVSGTYMQVLPRFVSIDSDGAEHEFLTEFFSDEYEALSRVFLKGYQWPFDSKKVLGGSSVIDLLVFYETNVKKRKVYLDFTKNPFGMENIEYEKLSSAAYEYLKNADAMFGKPIDRLLKMNKPAVELYEGKGVDLTQEYLEIALCAQHHNGGIAVDLWWMTSLSGLFAIGECAGTHGIARPGGSALNAGQVGALRATTYISQNEKHVDENSFLNVAKASERKHGLFIKSILNNEDNVMSLISEARRSMSERGAAIRDSERMSSYLCSVEMALGSIEERLKINDASRLYIAYQYRDILLSQRAVLSAMVDYSEKGYSSRGSAIICDRGGVLPYGLDEMFRFRMGGDTAPDKIQELRLQDGRLEIRFRPVRPLDKDDDFFENVWRRYREDKCVY